MYSSKAGRSPSTVYTQLRYVPSSVINHPRTSIATTPLSSTLFLYHQFEERDSPSLLWRYRGLVPNSEISSIFVNIALHLRDVSPVKTPASRAFQRPRGLREDEFINLSFKQMARFGLPFDSTFSFRPFSLSMHFI